MYSRKKDAQPNLSAPKELVSGATEQTLKKRRDDVALAFYKRGRLTSEQLLACEEIRMVWEAWGRGLFPSARRLDPDAPATNRRAFRDPVQRMRSHEEAAWRQRYRPWAEEMRVSVLAPTGVTRLQLILDVVVDNQGVRNLERRYGMRNGSAFTHILDSLARYCEIAGWTN
jgi:hypothetical protein